MSEPMNKNIQEVQTKLNTKFFQGLSSPTRYKIVEALLEGAKNVSEIVNILGLSQSQISNQLACLKWCGYVTSKQEGKYVYYQITDERIRMIIELARSMVADNAEHINCCTRL